MATRGERFAGVSVAIVTPFRNGQIDWAGLKRRTRNVMRPVGGPGARGGRGGGGAASGGLSVVVPLLEV